MEVETIIQYGNTVRQFITSEAGKAVLHEMGERYVQEWLASESPEGRENAWAKRRALADLQLAFKAVADTGEFEQRELDRKNRKK